MQFHHTFLIFKLPPDTVVSDIPSYFSGLLFITGRVLNAFNLWFVTFLLAPLAFIFSVFFTLIHSVYKSVHLHLCNFL